MLQSITNILQRKILRSYGATVAGAKGDRRRKPSKHKQKKESVSGVLISCKRSEFNLSAPEKTGSKFGTISLASNGWLHYKSNKDHFTINATISESEQQRQLVDITEFLNNNDIKLHPELLKNLKNELNITALTPVQAQGLPKVYQSNHTLIAAETGCGKTLTYLLPILQKILENEPQGEKEARKFNSPLALIVSPGRELATQIGKVAERLCINTGLKVATILGGNTKQLIVNPQFDDVDILVATMGAISKLVNTGIYRIGHVRHLVLDEADTLLDDSFRYLLERFLEKFPFHKVADYGVGTQFVLASATMPTNIEEQLQRVIDVKTIHEVVSPNLHKIMPHVQQKFIRMSKASRPDSLFFLVKSELDQKRPSIVFSNKTPTSDYVSIFLNKCNIKCINLNGDMLMKVRQGRFEAFQNGEYDVLSTTGVGSRGLDTTRARHVINFDFPMHVSEYIHRCGRIGRVAHTEKCFVTNFISSRREVSLVQHIEHAARTNGLLPDVNANIKGLINRKILKEMKDAGIELPLAARQDEVF